MLYKSEHRRFLLCVRKPINPAQPHAHHCTRTIIQSTSDSQERQTQRSLPTTQTGSVICSLEVSILSMHIQRIMSWQPLWLNYATSSLWRWSRVVGGAASGSTFWQFQYGFKKTCGWRDCCLCFENVHRDLSCFHPSPAVASLPSTRGWKIPWRQEETSMAKDVRVFCFVLKRSVSKKGKK